jgi:hypothetical protein
MPSIRLQFRRGNASEWTAANTLLAEGEMGIELDTRLFKIGDGVKSWTDLSYGGLTGTVGNVVSFDTSFNANVFVGGDMSMNKRVFIGVRMPLLFYDFENNALNLGDGGSTYDMTLAGAPSFTADAKYRSKALIFNGTSQYATISGYQFLTTGFSIAFWFKVANTNAANLMTFADTSGNTFKVYFGNLGTSMQLIVNNNSVDVTANVNTLLAANTWYYFDATVANGGSNAVTMSIGTTARGSVVTGTTVINAYPSTTNTRTITIAAAPGGASGFVGLTIDQLVIVNEVLTSGQLAQLFSQDFYIYTAPVRSTSMSSGALVVSGGAGVRGNLNVGQNVVVGASTASTSAITGALLVSGGGGFTGNVYVGGIANAASFNATSDYRVKHNVCDVSLGLIDSLRPVSYYNTLLGKPDVGFLAHEVQNVLPFLVNGTKDGADMQSLNYTGIIGLLVKEVQALKQEVTLLKGTK